LHDHRDAAIGGILRGVRFSQMLVGKSPDLCYLVGPDSVGS
jgi:hypothetical protein